MEHRILGLHHVTAIADNAQRNYNFYTKIFGLRMVKKTVNFDDPDTYHFYYGNQTGTPGTALTFFPWEGIGKGYNGIGITSEIAYSVPPGSMDFWKNRLARFNIATGEPLERFGEIYLPFEDPDGLESTLVVPAAADRRKAWTTREITETEAVKGFYNVTLSVSRLEPTAKILTDIFGYEQTKQNANRYRFQTDAVNGASVVDINLIEKGRYARNAGGTVHHIAFRVRDSETELYFREKLLQHGLHPTPQIDRSYFYSVYFREPGGILFEIATENPGFTTDETVAQLGTHLMLPPQYESSRKRIEKVLPPVTVVPL